MKTSFKTFRGRARLVKFLSLRRALALSVATLAGLALSQTAQAATYYWDANDATAGFGGAAGTWAAPTIGTATSGWSTDSTGLTAVNGNSVTTSNTDSLTDSLNFGTATDALSASTITISGTVASGNMTFGTLSGAITLNGGSIDLGAAAPTITVNNATNTVNSAIIGTAGFTKAGTGILYLQTANTYSGTTILAAGQLDLGTNTALGTSTLTINGGNLTPRLANRSLANNVTVGGNFTIGTTNVNNALTLSGSIDLGGAARTVTVTDISAATDVTFSGVISNGSLVKAGGSGSVLALTNANTYAGGTTVNNNGGTIAVSNGSALGTGLVSVAMGGGSNASGKLQLLGNITVGNNMSFGGSTVATNVRLENLSGNNTVTGNISFANTGGGFNTILSTAGSLALNGNLTATLAAGGGRVFNFSGAGATNVGGVISNGTATVAVTKDGAGTLTLSNTNTFTGATTINAGTISVGTIGNGGVSGNLGAATNVAANLVLGGGSLQYTGATASTDRNFTLNAATTSTIDVTSSTTNLTISGASAATTGGLTKSGDGILSLAGANAHTGNTTVNAGTLQLASTGSISGTALITVNSGAIFDVQAVSGYTLGSTQTLAGTGTVQGNVALAAGAKLSPGASAGTLTFANNLDLTATGTSNTSNLVFELGTSSDRVVLSSGTLSIGTGTLGFNDFAFTDLAGFGPGIYTLFQTGSLISGSLDGSNLTGTVGGISATLGFANGGNDLVLNVAAIPEPSTLVLGSLGGLGLAFYGLRRRRQS